MNASEARSLIDEAKSIAAQLHEPASIGEKADLLARAERLEARVSDERRVRDRQVLDAQIAALGRPGDVDLGLRETKVAPFAERFHAAFDRGRLGLKDVTISGGTDLSLPMAAPGVFQGDEPSIAGLLSQRRVEGTDQVSFMREAPYTNRAAVVASGGSKPVSDLDISRVTVPVEVVAHIVEGVPNQDLADSSYLREVIDRRGRYGLAQALDDEILHGDGTPATHMYGILEDSDLQSTAFQDDAFTTLRQAIADLRLVQVTPTAIVVHPADAAAMDALRDDQVFVVGGAGSPDRPWGVPRIESTYIDQGTALVGDFGYASLFMREFVSILADPFNGVGGSNSQKNLTDFRFELRAAVGIGRGDAFTVADLTGGS